MTYRVIYLHLKLFVLLFFFFNLIFFFDSIKKCLPIPKEVRRRSFSCKKNLVSPNVFFWKEHRFIPLNLILPGHDACALACLSNIHALYVMYNILSFDLRWKDICAKVMHDWVDKIRALLYHTCCYMICIIIIQISYFTLILLLLVLYLWNTWQVF